MEKKVLLISVSICFEAVRTRVCNFYTLDLRTKTPVSHKPKKGLDRRGDGLMDMEGAGWVVGVGALIL